MIAGMGLGGQAAAKAGRSVQRSSPTTPLLRADVAASMSMPSPSRR